MSKTRCLPFEMAKDERGSILPIFALMSTIAIAAVGGAVDFGHAYQMRTRMQNALDAAVLSGLAMYQQKSDWTAATTEAQNVFSAQFSNAVQQNANGNATAGLDIPIVQFTNNGTAMTGTASMTANTPFMNFIIAQNLSVGASTSASPTSSATSTMASSHTNVEVAMMVDLTGSMGQSVGGTTKIAALKTAGLSLLDILLPSSGANNSYVKVGIAPFADYVNAGSYASEVTNLPATSSSSSAYANISDLAHTGHGAFTGTYFGAIGSSSGSQSGSTPASAQSGTGVVPAATGASAGTAVTSGGGTYTSGYCATPSYTQAATTTPIAYMQNNGKTVGYYFGWSNGTVNVPTGLVQASSSSSNGFYEIDHVSSSGWSYQGPFNSGNGVNYYYVPVPASTAGLTVQTRTSSGRTYNVGFPVTVNSLQAGGVPQLLYGTFYYPSNAGSGTFSNYQLATGYYLPLYTSYTTTTPAQTITYAGCETASQVPANPQPTAQLISCVTERTNTTDRSLNYTDAAPGTSSWIGAYNGGSSAKSNYSSDGKCNVAGRELAPVIPLTNSRSTLQAFFNGPNGNGPLIGGGTPGHLGTAWAWYLLSPNWSSVWPTAPAAYNSTTTKKYAILMTDGEYNEAYYVNDTTSSPMSATTSASAATLASTCGSACTLSGSTVTFSKPATSSSQSSINQALALCSAMKAQGITVITVGFGYSVNNGTYSSTSTRGTTQTIPTSLSSGTSMSTSEQNAVYLLTQCASPVSSGHPNYYLPYSQADLADTFSKIGATVTTSTTVTQQGGRITN